MQLLRRRAIQLREIQLRARVMPPPLLMALSLRLFLFQLPSLGQQPSTALSFLPRQGRVRVSALLTQRVSKPILMTWKTTMARACYSWAAFGQADVAPRANIPAEKR